ncbi:MAG: DegV family protein [Erysipelotrichaceae bacterium]|nr:DegV family protein [Erysipelotrichaceae bacterium]
MSDYVITCCSTADLTDRMHKERGIPYACFTFEADGKTYKDDYGISYPADKFFEDIRNGMMPITSQVNEEAYKELFEPIIKEGKEVLHICLSSGISGTYNSAVLAAEDLNFVYGKKVHVVDSLCASSGYGMLVIMAKDNQDKGMSLEENLEWIEENKRRIIHWFFSSDLSSFIRGGRISKTAGFFGSVLQICPVMCVSDAGKLEVLEKTRTKKKASRQIVDNMIAEVGPDYDGYCYICNSACLEDAENIKKMLMEALPKLKEVLIFNIGGVIGSHTGPGTIALFYYGKKRVVE